MDSEAHILSQPEGWDNQPKSVLGHGGPWLMPVFLAAAVAVGLGAFWINPMVVFGAVCAGVGVAAIAVAGDWALLVVLVLRPVLVVIPELSIGGQTIGIDGILNIVMCGGFLVLIPFRKHAPIAKPYTWIALAFLLVTLASLKQSTDVVFGFRQWFRMFGYGVFFWIAYTASAENPAFGERMRKVALVVAVTLLGMGAIQMSLLLRQMSLLEYVQIMTQPGLLYRLNGFQDYPHTYANMLLVVTPILILSAWDAKRRRTRYVYYGLAGLCMCAIVYTGVRSAAGALAVEIIVFLVGSRRYRHLVTLGALFVVAGFGSGVFQARFDDLVNPQRSLEWSSLADRQEIWYAVDASIAERPLTGYGLGSVYAFVANSPLRHSAAALSSHCDYRKFAFESGIPGAICFVLLWTSVTWAGWRKRKTSPRERALCSAVAAIACAVMTIALVDEVMQDYAAMALYWSLAGTALGLSSATCSTINGPSEKPEEQLTP